MVHICWERVRQVLRTEAEAAEWNHILHICLGKYLPAVVCWLNQPNQYIGISQYPRSTNYRQSIAGGAKVKTFVTMQTHRQTHTPTLPATHTHMTWKHLSTIGSHVWGAYQHTKARDWNQKCWRICKTHVVKIKKRSVHIPNNQKLKEKQSSASSTLSGLNWTLRTVEPSTNQPSSQTGGVYLASFFFTCFRIKENSSKAHCVFSNLHDDL